MYVVFSTDIFKKTQDNKETYLDIQEILIILNCSYFSIQDYLIFYE